MNTVKEKLHTYTTIVEPALSQLFPAENCRQARIFDAARYSLLDGGKRLRPALFMEFYTLCSHAAPEQALRFACALEMIHTYSLIHDDLPCMDDDDFRRGRPSNHKAFDEATAVLAGDALLNRAFEIMMQEDVLPPQQVLQAAAYLGRCSGVYGMIGGQVIDLALEQQPDTDAETLRRMVDLKTGALLRAACVGGCILAGADVRQQEAAEAYADAVGLAFQIQDDILDVVGDTALLGKQTGSDANNQKTTFVSLYGIEECRQMVQQLTQQAIVALDAFENTDFLRDLALWLAQRDH